MKTFISSIVIIFSVHICFAQLTITSQYNPLAGDIDSYAICDTVNITQGNAGANQSWSFLNLVKIDTSDVHFVASASTPYTGQFTSSNLASSNDNSSYNYFTTSASGILFNGNGGPGLVVPYTNPQQYMQYPFTYNSSFSDNFGGNYSNGGIPTIRTGTINVSGDAWGTINLPVGSFPNALRVRYNIVTRDSSNPGAPLVVVTNLTSYVWFVPGRKYPVFEIVYTSLSYNGTVVASSKSINYNARSAAIGIQQLSTEIPAGFSLSQNYPNPFNPMTKLKFQMPKSSLVNLKVFDAIGREVTVLVNEVLTAGTYEADWNASVYTSGTYFYRLSSGDFSETKKMVLVK
jgi:Secretion system C-terminal sorting domain